jgi:hypothetical protein
MKRPAIIAILIASITSWLGAQDIVPNGPVATSVDSSGQPLVVMGLDLSNANFVRSEKDAPDIYEKSGKQRTDVFIMSLETIEPATAAAQPRPPSGESIWLKYATSVNRFYIEYRSDRSKPETERIYGPFAGDPFERFRLEPVIAARLRAGYSPNDLLSIGRMLKTQNATLSKRAMRLSQAAIECRDWAIVENVIREIRQRLDDNAATIDKLDLQAEKLALEQNISAAEAELEKLVVEIPEAQYPRPADSKNKLPAAIPQEAWGKAVDGLRAAAVPKQNSMTLSTDLPLTLVVENTSDHDIKFSFSDVIQSARVEVQSSQNQPLQADTSWFSGWAAVERVLLKPGESVALARVSVKVVSQRPGGDIGAIGRSLVIDDHRGAAASAAYQVRYTVPLATGSSWHRGEDGVMRRISPAKGEWKGTLTSGFVDFRVTVK